VCDSTINRPQTTFCTEVAYGRDFTIDSYKTIVSTNDDDGQ